jgi:NAD(P)-dependent dehydrogenase (short-subunit alcohol dehydrogenase family)
MIQMLDLLLTTFILTGKSLAVEWVEFARANSVSPGYVKSGLTGSAPEDLIAAVTEKIPMRYFAILNSSPFPV